MRTTSKDGVESIKQWEQLRLEAYLPTPRDRWTIGYGHTYGVESGDVCTEVEALAWLQDDLDWAERAVVNNVEVHLTQNQFDALVSLTFNIGKEAFKRSTLLEVLNAGKYDEVPAQIARWNKQKGKVLRGLVRRRAHEALLWQKDNTAKEETGRPQEPAGRKTTQIVRESKTAKAGLGFAGLGGTNLIAEVGEYNSLASMLDGASPYLWGIIAVGGLWFVYNRWLDSNKGKST